MVKYNTDTDTDTDTDTLDIVDSLNIRDYAFFFDIDGTLTEIKPCPNDVSLSEEVKLSLVCLSKNRQALALISGRTLSEIDKLTAPFILSAAAVHGSQLRHHDGRTELISLDHSVISQIREHLKIAKTDYPNLIFEDKNIAFAIHYRQTPELAGTARKIAMGIAEEFSSIFTLQEGKCVYEIKPCNVSKGLAVKKFMDTNLFRGKIPIYIGDDVTDESAFIEINKMKGISIKVGEGNTEALHRFASVKETIQWLVIIASKFRS